MAAYGALPAAAQLSWAWVTPALFIWSVGTFAFAGVCKLLTNQVKSVMKDDATQLLDDMDDIHPPKAPPPKVASSVTPAASTPAAANPPDESQ
jgi:hypothetical protein